MTTVQDRDGTPTHTVISEEVGSTQIHDIEVPGYCAPLGKTASKDELLTYLHDMLDDSDEKVQAIVESILEIKEQFLPKLETRCNTISVKNQNLL